MMSSTSFRNMSIGFLGTIAWTLMMKQVYLHHQGAKSADMKSNEEIGAAFQGS